MQFLLGRRSPQLTLYSVLNAAARLVTNTDKYDRGLSNLGLLHDQLHWLNVPERVEHNTVWNSLIIMQTEICGR